MMFHDKPSTLGYPHFSKTPIYQCRFVICLIKFYPRYTLRLFNGLRTGESPCLTGKSFKTTVSMSHLYRSYVDEPEGRCWVIQLDINLVCWFAGWFLKGNTTTIDGLVLNRVDLLSHAGYHKLGFLLPSKTWGFD